MAPGCLDSGPLQGEAVASCHRDHPWPGLLTWGVQLEWCCRCQFRLPALPADAEGREGTESCHWSSEEPSHRESSSALPHERHGTVGSPRPLLGVYDVDPLGPQVLDLDVTLLPRLLVAVLLHVGCHGLIDLHICLSASVKLPLHVCLPPDWYKVTSLLFCQVGDPG